MLDTSPTLSELCFVRISTEGLKLIASSHCGPLLRVIKADVDGNSIKAINSVCRACPNLRIISLWNSSKCLEGDEITQTIMQYCPLIESISIEVWALTDAAMNDLANIHSLKVLKLSRYARCSSQAIQAVLRSNPNLVTIGVEGKYVNDDLVCCIGSYCFNVRFLHVHKSSSNALSVTTLQSLFQGCPLLEYFKLHQSGGMTTATLRALFENCHHLAELDVFNSSPAVAPVVVESALFTYIPSLTKLKIYRDGLSASALRDIFTYCANLREVELNSCHQVNDALIKLLAQNCPSLDDLDLASCYSVTIVGILEIATLCPRLTRLCLVHMPVNDEFLVQLSLNCPSLTRLLIFGRSGSESGLLSYEPITEAGVYALVERCTDLTCITISGNMAEPLLATLDLEKLGLSCPHIEFDFTL